MTTPPSRLFVSLICVGALAGCGSANDSSFTGQGTPGGAGPQPNAGGAGGSSGMGASGSNAGGVSASGSAGTSGGTAAAGSGARNPVGSGGTGVGGSNTTSGGTSGSGGANAGGASPVPDAGSGPPVTPDQGLIGWASVDGRGLATTTGGEGGGSADVDNASDLRSAAGGSTRRVIHISGTITVSELVVGSNKTLVGVGTDATIVGGISIVDQSNVIIQNLRVNAKSSGAGGDGIHVEGSHHVWIDHDDIWDAPDGNLDITNQSDLVTVSWTRFSYSSSPGDNAHRFCVLIGSDDNAPDAGYLRVTFHHDWWADRVSERMPRVRYGQVHVFNNYFTSTGNSYCVRAGVQADIRIENNYFKSVHNPHEINLDNGTAVMSASGNTYDASSGTRDTRGNAFTPPYPFNLQAAPAVPAEVQAGYGPR